MWSHLGVFSLGFPPVSGGLVANEMSHNINWCCGFSLCAEQKGCKWKGHGSTAVGFSFWNLAGSQISMTQQKTKISRYLKMCWSVVTQILSQVFHSSTASQSWKGTDWVGSLMPQSWRFLAIFATWLFVGRLATNTGVGSPGWLK